MKYIILYISILIFPALSYSQCNYSYGKWDTTLSSMPTPRSVFSAVNHNDSIYIIGGLLNRTTFNSAGSVDIYVPATDTWIIGITEFSFPRLCQNACLIGDKIYSFGGSHTDGNNLTMFDSLHIYDIPSNSWKKGASLPHPRNYFGADTINGKIYVAGGGNGWEIKNTLYVYDPALDEWTEKAPMNKSRWSTCARSWNGKLYVFGGHGSNWSYSKSIEVYDPEKDEWTLLSDAITPRVSHAMFLFEDQLYAIGGYHSHNSSDETHNHTAIISRYDFTTDSWFDFHYQGDNIPDARRYSAFSRINDKFYLFGGGNDIDLFDNVWSYSLKSILQNMEIRDTAFSSESIEIDLDDYFASTGDEALSYRVCEGYDEEMINTSIVNSVLKIDNTATESGITDIAVNAFNSTDTISSNSFNVEIEGQTFTNSISKVILTVYPNPASNIVNLTCNSIEAGNATLEVFNTLGQVIEQNNIENTGQGYPRFELNVEDYVEGLYIVVLSTKNSAFASKLLIQH